jgi:hypothetical protein
MYLQLCDQVEFPVAGAVPQISKAFDTSGNVEFDFGIIGRTIQNNPWWVISTTPMAYTPPAAGVFAVLDAMYSV